MRVLVVGGESKLGKSLADKLRMVGRHDVVATTRKKTGGSPFLIHLNLMNPEWPKANGFDVIFLVAAITKVVDCEADPQTAWRTNADGPVTLALMAQQRGVHQVVFISSDAVERAPNLVYSRTKAYVESVLLPMGYTVVRPGRITDFDRLATDLIEMLGSSNKRAVIRWE